MTGIFMYQRKPHRSLWDDFCPQWYVTPPMWHYADTRLVPRKRYIDPQFDSMALSSPNKNLTVMNWQETQDLLSQFRDKGILSSKSDSAQSAYGKTINGALSVFLDIPSQQQRSATFIITWHFPNVERFGHPGNLYCTRFRDARDVANYVCRNLESLWDRTTLYHTTFYQSNLPTEWLDAASSKCVTFRGPTTWWAADGFFGGYEGSFASAPLNCAHVWNYAQTHARLFPEIGRNMRIGNLLVYLEPNGQIHHRQIRREDARIDQRGRSPHAAYIDGQTATIVAAYREYQMSPDTHFLKKIWPNLKQAVNWLIESIDDNYDGVPSGYQPNTYDCDLSGANTFIGSQYLAALVAAERMAMVMNEPNTVFRWQAIREKGTNNQDVHLWNGEYYIQIPDQEPSENYNNGCHSDQLLGQWWAHQLHLGYLYPPNHVQSTLQSIMKYNFYENFAAAKVNQTPRIFVAGQDGGLLCCTWPYGDRPKHSIYYADEAWSGVEYAVAAAMIYEGLIEEARKIVRPERLCVLPALALMVGINGLSVVEVILSTTPSAVLFMHEQSVHGR
jgi:uncharacterized protein (DUF608 family)